MSKTSKPQHQSKMLNEYHVSLGIGGKYFQLFHTVKSMLIRLLNLEKQPTAITQPKLTIEIANLTPIRRLLHDCIFFRPESPEALAAAANFQAYLERKYAKVMESPNADPFFCAILAAGLLTYGRLDLVEVILDAIPDNPPQRPTGSCVVLGSTVLSHLLPLPPRLQPISGRSHCNKQAVRTWFHQHHHQLCWHPEKEKFVLE